MPLFVNGILMLIDVNNVGEYKFVVLFQLNQNNLSDYLGGAV